MAVSRQVKWLVGVVVLVVLSLTPSTCIRWVTDKAAAEGAERVAAVQRVADSLRSERDSALRLAAALEARVPEIKERLVYVRAQVPPPPPATLGCEACEARARALEAVIVTADSVIAVQDTVIAALHVVIEKAEQEATELRAGLADAKTTLAELAKPRPVVTTSFLRKILPTIQGGYGGVVVSGPDGLRVQHGPGLLLGWRIAL